MRRSPPVTARAHWLLAAVCCASAAAQSAADAPVRQRLAVVRAQVDAAIRTQQPIDWAPIADAVAAAWTQPALRGEAERLLDAATTAGLDRGSAANAAAVDRMAALPGLAPGTAARVRATAGELAYYGWRLAAAAEHFLGAAAAVRAVEPPLACFLAARAFHVRIAQSDFAAAATALALAEATASTAEDRCRNRRLQAELALRTGLLADAAAALQAGRSEPAPSDYERQQRLRLETDLALILEDLPGAAAAAEELLARVGGDPHQGGTAQMARLALLQIEAYRAGASAVLEPLRRLLAEPSLVPANRAAIGAALVTHLMLAGDVAAAARAVDEQRAGRPFAALAADELIAFAWALLADPTRRVDLAELGAALDAQWQRLLAEWRGVAANRRDIAFLQLPRRRSLLVLCVRLHQLRDPAQAPTACLDHLLQCEALGSTARRLGLQPTATAAQLVELLPPDGAWIAWLPAHVGSLALVLDRRGAELIALPDDRGLREQARTLRRAISAPDAPVDDAAFARATAAAAAQVLPAPLRARLATVRSLAIVGRELLAGLPLECLPSGDRELPWLGLTHAITYVPSLLVTAHLAARPPAPTTVALRALAGTAIAAADAERWQLRPPRIDRDDLEAIAVPFGTARCDLRLDATVADLAAAPPLMLCLFAHGVHDAARPDPTGFVLGAGAAASGSVFPADCERLAAAPLTFLGVCGAGRVPLQRGEDGTRRLGTNLLLAGAQVVVLGDGDLAVTDALAGASALAAATADAVPPAEALRRFRIACRAAGHTHPAQWAGLHLEGLPAPRLPLPAPTAPGTRADGAPFGVALGVALLLVVAALAMRRRARAAQP